MPRPKNPENIGLPLRWRFTHGAFYYQVPPGTEPWWDFKRMFRLGTTFQEALTVFEDMCLRSSQSSDIDPSTLLSLSSVISQPRELIKAGVYFLIKDNEIVYVGRSDAVLSRLAQHADLKIIDFDSYHVVPAEGLQQTRLEQIYIGKFKPKHNIRGISGPC